MSGRKCSKVRLDSEREQRSRLLGQTDSARREVEGISRQIADALRHASEGVLQQFAQEAQEAQQWLERGQAASTARRGWTMSNASSNLSNGLNQLQGLVRDGQQTQKRLTEVFTNRANRLRRELQSRLAHLDGMLSSRRTLFHKWLGEVREQQLQRTLSQARQSVQADAFSLAEKQLNALQRDFENADQQASQKEAEHMHKEHARELAAVWREVDACALALKHSLQSASAGLQATFASEVQQADQWRNRESDTRQQIEGINDGTDVALLRSAIERLRTVLRDGHTVTETVRRAFTEQASELRAQGETQVSAVEMQFNGGRELLNNWFGEQEVQRIQTMLQHLHQTLFAERLRKVDSPCRALREELEAKLHHAEEQESKHQRRLYLLKALRQVCAEMGFGEAEPPRYEQDGDRSSRITLTLDTFNQGLVSFHLSLEGIEADSGIAQEHCFEEFDKLSVQLVEQFGVQTKFRPAEGEPQPRLIRKGAQEEPSGVKRALAR